MSKGNGTAAVAIKKGDRPSSIDHKKSYASEGVKDNDIFLLPGKDYQIAAGLTIVALIVRLFRIYQPSSVVFDEVHFGGFASKYIKGQFFMDVHPPLAKLLLTLAGWLAGFDGSFDFKDIGKDYIEPKVPYVAMRLLPAILGVTTIPTMYFTLKALGCRSTTAAMGATLVLFDNALVTQSRLILLDSPLIAFTAFTALAFTSFNNQHELGPARQFTLPWWIYLTLTGVGLGLTVSVKWVGLFTIGWVGSITLVQLWQVWGDYKNVTPRLFTKHFLARVLTLIMIPTFIYMFMFAIHFICLVNPGEGDGFMSSEFQATLNSKAMLDTPVDIAFGSRVTIRHHNTQGGYLHSHSHMYPTGSKQQQVTLYPHKDENNIFLIENMTQPLGLFGQSINGSLAWDDIYPPNLLKNGDVIRLYHTITNRRIHSHEVRPPVSEVEWQNEVSAYGYEGFDGDANDYFRVEIVKDKTDGERAKEYVRAIETKFRLIHIMSGCALFSHKVKLPDWGFEQQEVTCAKMGTLPNSIWYIEQNNHPQLDDDAEKVNYKNPGFIGKFLELQQVMWTTNAGLTDSHAWDSRPPSWPFLLRGINFWGKDNRQIYLIGNPVIWWTSSAIIFSYFAMLGLAALRWQRGYVDYLNLSAKRFTVEVGLSVAGWGFHYFPFFLMARQLFLHHYLPALYFAIMALSVAWDHVTNRITELPFATRPTIGRTAVAAFLALSITVFALYTPLAYGGVWTQSACQKVKLFEAWDWECSNFLPSLADYDKVQFSSPAVAEPPAAEPRIDPLHVPADQYEGVVTPQADEAQKSGSEAGKRPQVDVEGNSHYVPDHPEVDPGTPVADVPGRGEKQPESANADRDIAKEQQAERNRHGNAKPASDKKSATKEPKAESEAQAQV